MNRLIALLVVIALTSGCATNRTPPPLTKIPNETDVLLVVQQADAKLPDASADGDIYAKNVGAGLAAGVGMGAIAGFGAGIVCGPMIVICGPVGAIGGAMGGAVFGIGFGTISAATLQLPQKKAEVFDEIMIETIGNLDITEEVSATFQSHGAPRWNFVDEDAAVEVQIVLEGIGLEKHKKNQVTISLRSSLIVKTGSGDNVKVETRQFDTSSGMHHIDYWIDAESDNFRDELLRQLSVHAQDMFAHLRMPNNEWTEVPAPTIQTAGGSDIALTSVTAR
jgi:hypothetical protein